MDKAQEPAIQEYRVSVGEDFEMDFAGDSPEEAARAARTYLRTKGTDTSVFAVVDPGGKAFRVDLHELDGASVG